MIDHITIAVGDLEKSKLFYERAFEPLGYRLSFGKEGVFWAFDVGGSLFEIQHTDDKPPLSVCTLPSGSKAGRRSTRFIGPRSKPVLWTMGRPARGRNIARTIMPALFSIPTDTISKP
ncbi:hypothetical protein CUJ84_Chr002921 [Rhizobium leguminosarum]|uniref:Glyoxalase/fosfomycin resistance/dioxygenase domain-containing protein n=1 Tax=Rhizobium leguminosarum TaxID=384 RepID=A0A2K9Z4W0_RHILE|nr:hypothetical protein CUJ84_Chr002921 [Rhizobium leguminosarum]